MKNILLVVAIVIVSVFAAPFAYIHYEDIQEKRKLCTTISEAGERYMMAYQKGVPKAVILEVLDVSKQTDNADRVTLALINKAYESERYTSVRLQEKAAENFGKQVFSSCRDWAK